MTQHLTRQQLCAALSISKSTVRRLESRGTPYTPVGVKFKRYDLSECKQWLKENHACLNGQTPAIAVTSALWSGAKAYTESFRKAH